MPEDSGLLELSLVKTAKPAKIFYSCGDFKPEVAYKSYFVLEFP